MPPRTRRTRDHTTEPDLRGLQAILGAAVVLGAIVVAAGSAGQTTPYTPRQSDRPEPMAGDESRFESIFDGKTLAGWEGNPTYWRAENGALVGEITPATTIKSNTFII